MMQNYITPARIANSILQKSKSKLTYLIVEGNNDFTLYRKFVNEQYCQVEIAFGNTNVIDVIIELDNRGFQDAIGLIDADFRVLDNDIPAHPSIFLTDEHDIELMIFKSDAFETIITHYSEPNKLANFKIAKNNNDLRAIFLNLALPLGYLKWANKKSNLGLVFKPLEADANPLNISEFIPPNTLTFLGYEKMTETVINYSRNKSKNISTKANAISEAKKLFQHSPDLYHLCNGHDVINVVSISLKRKISSMNSNALQPEQLEKELIFAYDSRYFEQTKLYTQIKDWEQLKAKSVLKF